LVATDEAAGLEVVRRTRAAAEEQPLRADERPAPQLRRLRLHGHRFTAAVLDVHLEVVLEVLADAGQVLDRVDSESPKELAVADARQLEELRGVDGAAREDDLACL